MADTCEFPCEFRLSWRTICGTATFVDPDGRHNHVLRLHIRRSLFDMAINWVARWLPASARKRIQALIPGSFLPPTVIIKKLKPTWDTEFNDEKRIYQRLSSLQGHAIPVLYREGLCHGARALLLSDVGDTSLHAAQVRHLSKSALKSLIKPAVRAMLKLGVEPADHNPRNYHLVRGGDAVVVLDFEDTADFDPDERDMDELAEAVADGVAHWTVFYHQNNSS